MMLKKSKLFFLLVSMTFALSTNASRLYAGNDDAKNATQKITALLNNITSTSAHFSQSVSDPQGKILQSSKGVMKIKRPLRFIWNTAEPYEQVISSDGETMWIYDKDLEQVTVQALNTQAGDTPALLFSGDPAVLAEHFDVRQSNSIKDDYPLDGNTNSSNKTKQIFDLYPLDQKAAFSMMSVTFENKKLVAMELKDHLGQRTEIFFDKVELNPVLLDKSFVFNPPEGVDIIHNKSSSE
ncbi:MAG TPA: outer membrane lipoprotein chaperone LolA [Pseudomonadales bacterium]